MIFLRKFYFIFVETKQKTMTTYKLEFDNGSKFQTTTKSLCQAHKKIVRYMNNNNLHTCTITCPNGIVRRVCKTGAWHPIHNEFIFD